MVFILIDKCGVYDTRYIYCRCTSCQCICIFYTFQNGEFFKKSDTFGTFMLRCKVELGTLWPWHYWCLVMQRAVFKLDVGYVPTSFCKIHHLSFIPPKLALPLFLLNVSMSWQLANKADEGSVCQQLLQFTSASVLTGLEILSCLYDGGMPPVSASNSCRLYSNVARTRRWLRWWGSKIVNVNQCGNDWDQTQKAVMSYFMAASGRYVP